VTRVARPNLGRTMVTALAPATRTVAWAPFGACAAAALAVVVVARSAGFGSPHVVAVVAAGVLAGGAALALDDPADVLLAPVPVSVRRRLALRLVAVVAACGLVWWGVDVGLGHGVGVRPEALAALIATGVGVTTIVGRARPDLAADAGAAVVLAWAIVPATVDLGALAGLGTAWTTRPAAVTVAAVAGIALGGHRR